MPTDWAAHVRKYDPAADEGVIAGIVRYCGIALRNRDSSLVSFSDPKELARVRDNFLKKKLALTAPDNVLDDAIAAVAAKMKGDRTKNRVTVYYLLAQSFGMLALFAPKPRATTRKPAKDASEPAVAAGGGAALAGGAALGLMGKDAHGGAARSAEPAGAAQAEPEPLAAQPAPERPVPAPAGEPVAAAPSALAAIGAAGTGPAALHGSTAAGGAGAAGRAEQGGSDLSWLWWLLAALILVGLVWWLVSRDPAQDHAASTATGATGVDAGAGATGAAPAAAASALAAAPAEGSVAIPDGAGVTSELREGKPVVKVYFDTGSTALAPAFSDAASGLAAWLAANPGSSLAVSGYNDSTGNAAVNAELSKNRAFAVRDALTEAGIAEGSVELVRPADTAAGAATGADAAARRVEVVVR